jgi:putative ABC transport system permease protein
MGRSASDDMALILRKGATAEIESVIDEPNVNLVLNDKALPVPASGPRGVAEAIVVILLERVGGNGGLSNVQIRGIPDGTFEFRRGVKIVAGRAPRPGSDEVAVGSAVRGRFVGLDVDQSFELKKNRPVKVVGVFSDNGSSYESEVWADINTVRTAFHREGAVSTIRARVEPSKFDAYKASIESNRQLNVQVLKEAAYYEKQSEGTATFISALGITIAVFFSLGAMLGAMITMHAAVANRQREIGTLRALGFSKGSILFSFLLESIFLSLLGGLLGAAASLAMGSVRFSMVNWSSWSEVVFTFEPTPSIIVGAIVFATAMGLFGGFLPAIRAARVSPVDAMRT